MAINRYQGYLGQATVDMLQNSGYDGMADVVNSMRNLSGYNMNKAIENGWVMSPAEMQSGIFNNQLSLDMYNQTQSFQAQVNQMREAGLNPAMMYGESGGVNSTGGASAGSTSTGSAVGQNNAIGRISGILGMITQLAQTSMSLRSTALDNQLKENEIEKGDYDNSKMGERYDREVRASDDTHELALSQIGLNAKNADGVEMQTYLHKCQADTEKFKALNEEWNGKLASLDFETRKELNESVIALNRKLYEVYGEQITKMTLEQALLDRQVQTEYARYKSIVAQTGLFTEQTNTQKEETKSKQYDNKYADENHFLRYMGTVCDWLDTTTNMAVGAGSANLTGVQELYRNSVGSALASVQKRFGGTPFYAQSALSNNPDYYYPVITPVKKYQVSNQPMVGKLGSFYMGYSSGKHEKTEQGK